MLSWTVLHLLGSGRSNPPLLLCTHIHIHTLSIPLRVCVCVTGSVILLGSPAALAQHLIEYLHTTVCCSLGGTWVSRKGEGGRESGVDRGKESDRERESWCCQANAPSQTDLLSLSSSVVCSVLWWCSCRLSEQATCYSRVWQNPERGKSSL